MLEEKRERKKMKYDTEPIRSCSIDVTEACNLACTYCHRKGTPILMENFTTKPIEEIKIGDSVIGFLKPGIGKFQKLAISKVIGTQKRLSPVISMETDRGSTFCSSDHKWWNGRHYIPAKEGMKVFSIYDGKIVTPQCSRDYKMGWLCGMFARDGTNGKYKYENDPITFFKDSLILDQASLWAKEFGFDMNHFEFSPGFNGIRKYSKGFWNFIHTILYTDEFKRGWIAGFFDAEGGTFHVNLRIHQNEGKYKEILKRYLIDFGFIFKNEKKSVRILGGSKEYIRFFIFFNPVLKRKIGKLIGISLRGRTEIKKVTPIADEEMVYNITTTTGNYFASGFASKNCFTWGKTKRRLGEKTGRGIIDFFFDHADPDADHYEVTFWGGEPLLEFPLIKKLIPYAANKSDKVVFGGTTNGLLLDEEKLKYLGDHKAKMMISWDGVKEVHDQYRVYPSGKGSWDDLAKKIPVIVRLWPDARFRMSLSRGMLPHMAESIEWIYDQGVKWLAFSAVFEEKWNTGEFERLKEEYTKVAEFMNAHQDLHIHHMSDPGGGIWQDYPCGAGRAYVGFSVDGKIYPCLYGDAKVICNPNIKTMETVQVGDKVLSHDGFYYPITKIWSRQYSGDMIGVKPLYSNEFQWATPNHEVLAIRGRSCRHWHRICKDSCKGYWQTSQKRFVLCKHKSDFDIKWVPIGELTKNDFLAYPILKGEKDIPYEEDLLYLFGWFLAEGSTSGKNKKPQIIKFSLGAHEENIANILSAIFQKYYGKSGTIKHYPENNKITFYVCNTKLAQWFENQFGKGARNKRIPHRWLFAPIKKQKALLRGLFYGDGTHYRKQTSFTTISELLATQVRAMLLRQRVPCGYITRPKHGIHKESYNVNIGQSFSNKLFEKWQIYLDKDYQGRSWFTDDYFIVPIKDINMKKHSGLVYNLEVEKAHSYVNSLIFSNCHRFNHYGDKNKEVRDKWRIGDIWNGFNEKRQVFLDYPDIRKEQCGECPIYKFCAGGCYACHADMCGSIFGIMPHFCEHQKILFEIGAKKVEQRRQPKRHEGKPCVCYNMCYLEGTDEEIYYTDKSSGMSCICYAVAYSGPSGKDVARRLATWDNNGK